MEREREGQGSINKKTADAERALMKRWMTNPPEETASVSYKTQRRGSWA